MKKIAGSPRELILSWEDLAERIRQFHWENHTASELRLELQRCIRDHGDLAKAYSILKEIIKRITGLTLFDSQLAAAYSMQKGRVAELPTGEGKTLSAVVAAVCFALQGKPVHLLVFNDYLARRDFTANRPIYEACGLTCGYIAEASDVLRRKAAYSCHVVYVSAKEAAFDYLRDFLCMEKENLLFGSFSVALVDEADSVLIDEARTPLVLAGNEEISGPAAARICGAVSRLAENEVCVNMAENQVWLTETGITAIENMLQNRNLFSAENHDLLALLQAALEARFLVAKDRDYIVKDGNIFVVDETTGRIAEHRRFPDLLQQAVEAKELLSQNIRTVVYHSMTMQAFLRQYPTLCGMTGTAVTSAAEFRQTYGLEVDVIFPHTPCIRQDHEDCLFLKEEEQVKAVLDKIRQVHAKGQPILIGTQSVQESEEYSALLTEMRLEHCVLNAKNDEAEAGIIKEAGGPYRITISTNMAGRGVDIKLGGSGEEQADFVRRAGGLFVLGTGINRSVRMDNQLRGRAGRQGDPGESQFFVCLEKVRPDTLFDLEFYKVKRYPRLLRRAQKLQESRDAEARYILERYSRIQEGQRRLVTDYRTKILLDLKEPEILKNRQPSTYRSYEKRYGAHSLKLAEKQLTLYFINANWTDYLAALEDKRSGIHLTIIGGKNPLEEYQLFAASAFHEMWEDIQQDVLGYLKKCEITGSGIDLEAAGLLGATTTWTYVINESANQFSAIPRLRRAVSGQIRGTLFTVRGVYRRMVEMIKSKAGGQKM